MIQTRANYCKTNGLSFNPNISKIMIFSKTSIDFDLIAPIYLNGLAIDCTEKIKYLGTTSLNQDCLFRILNQDCLLGSGPEGDKVL